MWLDSVNAPTQDAGGKAYSLVGRIQAWVAAAKGEGQAQGEAALTAIDDDGNPATISDEPSEPYHAPEVPEAKSEPDPFAELKAAHEDGKIIQMKLKDDPDDTWDDILYPEWGGDPDEYRIKPESSTFEAHGYTWTRHTPGDPCPARMDRFIFILVRGGEILKGNTTDFAYWGESCPECDQIIGWRYADEPAQAQRKPLPIATLARDQIDMTPAMAEAVEAVLREERQEAAQPTTSPGWTPAVGDTVRLKSGGPVMTVATICSDTEIVCRWWNGITVIGQYFPTACLTTAKEGQP